MFHCVVLFLACLSLLPRTTVVASTQQQSSDGSLSSSPISLSLLFGRKGWSKRLTSSRRWAKAREMVLQEQAVEDYNGQHIATSTSAAQACRHRRLIALPLTDVFDPPMGVFSHGHIQTGDKMSLPKNFWTAINLNKAEVPWLFSVQRIDVDASTTKPSSSHATKSKTTSDAAAAEADSNAEDDIVTPQRVEFCTGSSSGNDATEQQSEIDDQMLHEKVIVEHIPANTTLSQVVGGPLDFRAPPLYIFLPEWMMRALGIRPGEIVQVDLITNVPPGALVKLRPHSSKFAKSIANPQAVMETELRHYSSLTKGSTIAMDYNDQRYWFDVVDCKAAPVAAGTSPWVKKKTIGGGSGGGESVPFIKVQDCDIATDFLPDRETRKEQARKRRERQQEKKQQKEQQQTQ